MAGGAEPFDFERRDVRRTPVDDLLGHHRARPGFEGEQQFRTSVVVAGVE
jgi:hypothetical protein